MEDLQDAARRVRPKKAQRSMKAWGDKPRNPGVSVHDLDEVCRQMHRESALEREDYWVTHKRQLYKNQKDMERWHIHNHNWLETTRHSSEGARTLETVKYRSRRSNGRVLGCEIQSRLLASKLRISNRQQGKNERDSKFFESLKGPGRAHAQARAAWS